MSWGLDLPGGPNYAGHCPICGRRTHTNHDELCEDCFDEQPIVCPYCGEDRQPDQFRTDGKCNECHQYDEMEKAAILKDAQGCWAGDW